MSRSAVPSRAQSVAPKAWAGVVVALLATSLVVPWATGAEPAAADFAGSLGDSLVGVLTAISTCVLVCVLAWHGTVGIQTKLAVLGVLAIGVLWVIASVGSIFVMDDTLSPAAGIWASLGTAVALAGMSAALWRGHTAVIAPGSARQVVLDEWDVPVGPGTSSPTTGGDDW